MANNPYINKVEYAGQTLMDLTGDTVTPSDVLNGVSFHDRSGVPQQGSLITHDVYDGLDSVSTSDALSANQGKVLNDHIAHADVSTEITNLDDIPLNSKGRIQLAAAVNPIVANRIFNYICVGLAGEKTLILSYAPTNTIYLNTKSGGSWGSWNQIVLNSNIATEQITTGIPDVFATKTGNVVTLTFRASTAISSATNAWKDIGTLPIGLRPAMALYFMGYDYVSDTLLEFRLITNGLLSVFVFANKSVKPYGTVTYGN